MCCISNDSMLYKMNCLNICLYFEDDDESDDDGDDGSLKNKTHYINWSQYSKAS